MGPHTSSSHPEGPRKFSHQPSGGSSSSTSYGGQEQAGHSVSRILRTGGGWDTETPPPLSGLGLASESPDPEAGPMQGVCARIHACTQSGTPTHVHVGAWPRSRTPGQMTVVLGAQRTSAGGGLQWVSLATHREEKLQSLKPRVGYPALCELPGHRPLKETVGRAS